MKSKMIEAFKKAEGGLFSAVEKADVGSSYQELESLGITLMGWADPFMPDFSLPEHIKCATINAVNNATAPHYTAPIGNPDLKKLIAQKLKTKNGLAVDPERNILITPGSDAGLFFSMIPFIENGDEIIIPTPSYPNNALNVRICGGLVVPVELREEDGFQIKIEEFEKVLTPKTKMVVLTHPNNPTTTVFNKKSLESLAAFIIKNDLILVCDQAFEDFCYDNELITPAALPGMFERTITVFSFSKGMGLSGYRIAYLVCSDIIMDSFFANAVSILGATNTISQIAVMEALKAPEFMDEFATAFDYRRKKAYQILNSIPNVTMLMPESGFMCWLNVSKIGDSSDIVSYLVKEAKVSVNDGINYGQGGAGHLRIILGVYKDNKRVIDALEKIKEALIKYQGLELKED